MRDRRDIEIALEYDLRARDEERLRDRMDIDIALVYDLEVGGEVES